MKKYPPLMKALAIGIILWFVAIMYAPCIQATNTFNHALPVLKTETPQFELVGIEEIIGQHDEPSISFKWVIYVIIRNNRETIPCYSIKGEMNRISRPFHTCGGCDYTRFIANPWVSGGLLSADSISYSSSTSLIPGIYHIHLGVCAYFGNPYTTIMDGDYFIFLGFIFPKHRLRY